MTTEGNPWNCSSRPDSIYASNDRPTTIEDVGTLFKVFALGKPVPFTTASIAPEVQDVIPSGLVRETLILTIVY
ncbi:Glycine dehydrogenase (decarboxylating), mitochondrial [Artemisia annua]|uniref:Glycine dehydrogenase (Decarboxylating), mitochondrial n=1 Tax=Artemisia annua TaxID=35608 RepID=A0A2U1N4R3_ARTAN|nr:Glycine dehydrogenase (decarboxylating), mitochondrial [Artemisia annua]